MPVRLGRFEMPKRLVKDETTATDTYAKFTAEPFETGYGYTIGNSLRRVLLSSLEGAAITSFKVDGAMHEFTTVEGVVEDVTEIVLNLKKVKFKNFSRDSAAPPAVGQQGRRGHRRGYRSHRQAGAGESQAVDLHASTRRRSLEMELEVKVGRGFCPADENKRRPADWRDRDRLDLFAGDPGSVQRGIARVSDSARTTTSCCWRFGPTDA
jgi:DNA-directed RNA polymerase subunit alpha